MLRYLPQLSQLVLNGLLVGGHADVNCSLLFHPGLPLCTGNATKIEHRGTGISTAVFSPDNTEIITGGHDGTITRWGLGGEELKTFRVGEGTVRKIVLSPNGKIIATITDGMKGVTAWLPDGTRVALLRGGR